MTGKKGRQEELFPVAPTGVAAPVQSGGSSLPLVDFPLYDPSAMEAGNLARSYAEEVERPRWIREFLETTAGAVPIAGTELTFPDRVGSWKARWGINRMNYRVLPGLYGVGAPDETSIVLISANYKMSFDRLRQELSGLNAWVLVIDTKGINVWCAAGKGTFGTDEIVRRIKGVGLDRIVSHRTVIVPQLGAPGVAAGEVLKRTGFRVVYGPVRARDIKGFLEAGMKATAAMRSVTFGLVDRLVLTPIEVINHLKYCAYIAAVLIILHLFGLMKLEFSGVYPFVGAVLIGEVITPVLLPWVPGRAFSLKGAVMGLVWAVIVLAITGIGTYGVLNSLALILLLPAISSFLTLDFTGASTYTSLSGVRREMKIAIPAMIASASVGIILWLAGRFMDMV